MNQGNIPQLKLWKCVNLHLRVTFQHFFNTDYHGTVGPPLCNQIQSLDFRSEDPEPFLNFLDMEH